MALALLAIWLLVLLVPLHQVSAAQRGFASIGFETPGAWSICTAPDATEDGDQTPAAMDCPVTGAGKPVLALADTPPPLTNARIAPALANRLPETRAPPLVAIAFPLNPRAPPSAV